MATLTIDRRSGKIAGYNVQWYEGKRRFTIHLGGKRYAKKTAERLKEIVETLLYGSNPIPCNIFVNLHNFFGECSTQVVEFLLTHI